jgi:hypothetical protein
LNIEKLREEVTVGAIFVRTNHAWTRREGIATHYHFSVTDGNDTYHLVMNSDTQSWHLDGVQMQI